MIENFPKNFENKNSPEEEKLSLALEISESKEIFPFSGIKPEDYLKMKKDEKEFPDYVTPRDKLIERFKNEGMKIVLGKNPRSGNIFVLPAKSNDIEMDSILLSHLQSDGVTDNRLKKLIEM